MRVAIATRRARAQRAPNSGSDELRLPTGRNEENVLATRVRLLPLGHVVHFAVDADPSIVGRVVLGHLRTRCARHNERGSE